LTTKPSEYEPGDFEAILDYVHHTLCNHDKRDRQADRHTKWQSLEDIVKKMRGYPQNQDIWYLAEFMPKDERELIEKHPKNFNVRLTKKDRDLCGQSLTE
jgi:hypothetical protein